MRSRLLAATSWRDLGSCDWLVARRRSQGCSPLVPTHPVRPFHAWYRLGELERRVPAADGGGVGKGGAWWFKRQNEKNWVLICWISVPYLLFSMAATKMIAYPLFTAPAIFTVLAMFWWHLYDKPLKIYGLNQLILTTIIVLAVRYGYERMWLFKDTSFYETETQRIKSWNPDSKTVIFNLPERYIETMFYSSVGAAYPFLPDEQQIDSLKQKGYKVWIVRSPNLTPKLLSRRDVLFIEN